MEKRSCPVATVTKVSYIRPCFIIFTHVSLMSSMSHPCLTHVSPMSHPCLHLSPFLIHLMSLSSSNHAHMLSWTKFKFILFFTNYLFFLSYCTTLIQDILSMEKRGLLVATVTKLSSMRLVQESIEPKENVVSTLKNTLMSANCVDQILDINPSLMSICYSNIQIVMTKLNW